MAAAQTWRGLSYVTAYVILVCSWTMARFVTASVAREFGNYDILPRSRSLGSTCRSSLECLLFVPNSQCDWNERHCACRPYTVMLNDTMCLPASLLTYGCAVDEQCLVKVPNSQCTDGLCRCQQSFVPLRKDKCLPPARVHDFCLNEQQCHLGSKYSYCKYIIPRAYGKCQCPLNYLITADRQCLPHLTSPCENDEDCARATMNSFCRKDNGKTSCICKEGFHVSKTGLSCEADYTGANSSIPEDKANPTSLGRPCTLDVECRARDQHSACVEGICECLVKTENCSAQVTGCKKDSFQCRNGQCISWYFVCDKQKNCADGSDEEYCTAEACPKEAFRCNDGTCLSKATVCNGRWECPDGSDEARCYKGIPCDEHAFRCRSGQCLPQYVFCNAVIDCMDGSDEDEEVCGKGLNCPASSFRCDNNRCRSSAILCSGVDGCGDNSDETGCHVCDCQKP